MDSKINLPESVVQLAETMHSAHEEISQILLSNKQSQCNHADFIYLHGDWDETCKYCQIDACMLRKCKNCSKEYR